MMRAMKPYSEDLPRRIVRAVEGGMSKSGAARLFGVVLSSVKPYLRIAQRGMSLAPRKAGRRPPKTDQSAEKLLEEDLKERPAATTVSERPHFLEHTTGKSLSDSTVKRLLKKRLGFSQKTDYCGGEGARRMAKGRLEGDARSRDRPRAASVRGRDGDLCLSSPALGLVKERSKGPLLGAAQPRAQHHAAGEYDGRGYGTLPGSGRRDHHCSRLRGLHRESSRPEP